jgi:hypothetical protein
MGSRSGHLSFSGSSGSLFAIEDDVLRWPVITAAADDDDIIPLVALPATQQLPSFYSNPAEFAQMQSPLLANEVFSQYRQALEEILHSTSSANSRRISKMSIKRDRNTSNSISGGGSAPALYKLIINIADRNSGRHSSYDDMSSTVMRPSDLLLLSQYPLKDGLHSLRSCSNETTISHCLALVRSVSESHDDDCPTTAKTEVRASVATVWEWSSVGSGSLRVLGQAEFQQLLARSFGQETEQQGRQQSPRGSWHLTPVLSLVTEVRLAEALAGFQAKGQSLLTLSSVLHPRSRELSRGADCTEGPSCDDDTQAKQHECLEKGYLSSRGLNPSQMGAALHAVTIAQDSAEASLSESSESDSRGSNNSCWTARSFSSTTKTVAVEADSKGKGPTVLLVQGPPGTGKTTTLAALLISLVEGTGPTERVLACAPTNAALGEVGRRVLGHIQNQHCLSDFRQSHQGCSLLGRISKTRQPQPCKVLNLSNIVLVAGSSAPGQSNTSAAAKLEKLLEPISLKPRIQRLWASLRYDEHGLVQCASTVMAQLRDAPRLFATAVKESEGVREMNFVAVPFRQSKAAYRLWLFSWLPSDLRALASQAANVEDDAPPSLFKSGLRARVRWLPPLYQYLSSLSLKNVFGLIPRLLLILILLLPSSYRYIFQSV